jgi:teichuronic acid biosynthesis glycosyltransferase TuaH
MADPAIDAPSDVVFCFSYLSWQAAAKRGWFGTEDRLARGLLEHERVSRLLVCDQMRSLPVMLARDAIGRARKEDVPFPRSRSAELLRPVRLRREYPTSITGIERSCAAFDRAAERAATRMGMKRPAVILASPLLAGFAKLDWAGSVTFFATDDWLAYEPQRRWWPAFEESFARVRAGGRRVVAVSKAALERISPSGQSAVIPNGLDPQEWQGYTADASRQDESTGPLLLYPGTLDSRLDTGALLGLASAMPDARIVLVGPLVDPAHLQPLSDAANIEIRPPLERPEILALIRRADVGLLPHHDSALTRAMSPLKLYEYLAAGLPVVASDLPPVRDVHGSVTVVGPGESYAPAVRAALSEGRASEMARTAFVEANSWRARQDRLLELALA